MEGSLRFVLLGSNCRWPELKLDKMFEIFYQLMVLQHSALVKHRTVQQHPALMFSSAIVHSHQWIIGTAVQAYCNMDRQCNCITGSSGGWSRVAYLNTTDTTQQCPPAWTEIIEPVRTCGRSQLVIHGCLSTVYSSYGITYSHVCGRITRFQYGGTRAFYGYNSQGHLTIEEPFVDGVVITHGSVKQHIWTFAAALSEDPFYSPNVQCPCTDVQNAGTGNTTIPPFVGDDYFCETAITSSSFLNELYPYDPLWDGKNCGSGSTCCEFNNPPYLCKNLSEATADDIKVRLCANKDSSQASREEEDTPIQLIEIYIQ